MMKHAILALVLIVDMACAWAAPSLLQDGDLIFHKSRSSQSLAVQRATGSPYSHMGIVFMRNGKPFVFEASSTVRYTALNTWIARGERSHYVVKRLKNASTALTPSSVQRLRKAASPFAGRPYDLTFEWSNDRIYCSELVWKIYDKALGIRIGELQKIKDFNLSDLAVQTKLRERYGGKVPREEPVISPVSMFDSPLLTTILDK